MNRQSIGTQASERALEESNTDAIKCPCLKCSARKMQLVQNVRKTISSSVFLLVPLCFAGSRIEEFFGGGLCVGYTYAGYLVSFIYEIHLLHG